MKQVQEADEEENWRQTDE